MFWYRNRSQSWESLDARLRALETAVAIRPAVSQQRIASPLDRALARLGRQVAERERQCLTAEQVERD